jgi:ATP-dependent Lhr-like helicase
VLLLDGRAWRATHPDWRRRQAYVEPAEDEGRSQWRGEDQSLGHEVYRAIRAVLAGDETPPWCSRRASARLADVRAEYPWLDGRPDNVLVAAGGALTWWTFAGGRANAGLAAGLSGRLGVRAAADNFAVRLGTPPDPAAAERAVLGLAAADAGRMAPPVGEEAVAGLKFSECLPPTLAAWVVRERLTDASAASAALGRPTRVVLTT